MEKCNHPYLIARGVLNFCLQCKQFVVIKEEEKQELIMPPVIFEITEGLWSTISPWPLMPFSLVKSNGWYISMIGTSEYLIMPVQRKGKQIYFSARRLGNGSGMKYLYPAGVKKEYWTSSDELERDPIVFCEGVADAVFCSKISSSIAVLGSYYNGSLDSLISSRDVVICFDADAAGIIAAVNMMAQFKNIKSKRIVILPKGKDPTDIPLDELTVRIKGELI